MRTTRLLLTAVIGLLLTGYAAISTAAAPAGPTPEVRQALAPTGKLRVGLQLGKSLER